MYINTYKYCKYVFKMMTKHDTLGEAGLSVKWWIWNNFKIGQKRTPYDSRDAAEKHFLSMGSKRQTDLAITHATLTQLTVPHLETKEERIGFSGRST